MSDRQKSVVRALTTFSQVLSTNFVPDTYLLISRASFWIFKLEICFELLVNPQKSSNLMQEWKRLSNSMYKHINI